MRITGWLAVLAVGLATDAIACSPIKGYRVPTNIELLEQADLIVLARAVSGPDNYEDAWADGGLERRVVLKPQRVLKGESPPSLLVEGIMKDRDGEPFVAMPTELDQSHPSSLWGACVRQAYAKDTLLLAMFNVTAEGYQQVGAPFARAIEDVEGPNGLWVRAAQLYLKLLSEPDPAKRRISFQRERDRLLALKDDAEAHEIASDITAYLKATTAE